MATATHNQQFRSKSEIEIRRYAMKTHPLAVVLGAHSSSLKLIVALLSRGQPRAPAPAGSRWLISAMISE